MVIAPSDADSNPANGHQVTLNASGDTAITVTVTAPNGSATKVYTVTLTKLAGTTHPLSPDATLSALSLSDISIGVFDSAVTEYRYDTNLADALAGSAIETVTVAATPAGSNANVSVTPPDADSGTTGHQVDVSGNTTVIKAVVTAQDGTRQTYSIRHSNPFAECELADFNALVTKDSWRSGCESLDRKGSYAHYHSLVLHERGEVSLRLRSGSPDRLVVRPSYLARLSHHLILRRKSDLAELARDGGGDRDDRDAQVTQTLDAGTYVIETLAHAVGQEQDYTLTLTGGAIVLPGDAELSSLALSGVNMAAFTPGVTEYARNVAGDVTATTVIAVAAQADHGATVSVNPAFTDTQLQQVALNASGDTVITVTVTSVNGANTKAYTVTLTKLAGTTKPLSIDATLSALSLSGVDIGTFNSGVTEYDYVRSFGQILDPFTPTVAAPASHAGATATIAPDDASPGTVGHQVLVRDIITTSIRSGSYGTFRRDVTTVKVKVTAQDGATAKTYTARPVIPFARDQARDISLSIPEPAGIWSDGTTLWIADTSHSKIFAYTLETRARNTSQDFNTLRAAGNGSPTGLWSDGKTMWVADKEDRKIYAYNLATKARVQEQDFGELVKPSDWIRGPRDIWSDGDKMWVVEPGKIYTLYIYDLETKRYLGKDDPLARINNRAPRGLWSDGVIAWVTDRPDYRVYAYRLDTWDHVPELDIDTRQTDSWSRARGLWSDGKTMWVVDQKDRKVYAHNMPASARLRVLGLSDVDFGLFVSGSFSYEANVANSVPVTTITDAPAFPSGAVVAISNNGVTTDADTTTAGYQVNLAAGANVITITVTAHNGQETETYTVTVNRAAS